MLWLFAFLIYGGGVEALSKAGEPIRRAVFWPCLLGARLAEFTMEKDNG